LPKTDNDIDSVLGLAVFYQHVRTAALNQHPQHVTAFTTELFAHYLRIKCLSVTKCQQLNDTSNSQTTTYEGQLTDITDTQQLFIADVLLWKLIMAFYGPNFVSVQQTITSRHSTNYPNEQKTSDLVELLQTYALEHMTTFRQIEAQDFGSVATIVTTDIKALYAYKRGDYQQCLELSTQNVHTLLNAEYGTSIPIFPEFVQLLDDDAVSLTALTLIVDPERRDEKSTCHVITQLTLSLYLMTQCQLKLRHPVSSLAQTLEYIAVARSKQPVNRYLLLTYYGLNRLILKMIAQKARTYITTMMKI